MKIFWVEDFDILKNGSLSTNKIITETKYFLEPLLSQDIWDSDNTDRLTEGDLEIIDYIAMLANNKNPILWAGDLPSALACIQFGTKAYLNDNKYRTIQDISFPFDFAIIDFYIPTSLEVQYFSQLTPEAKEYVEEQYKYFKYSINKDEFSNSPLREFLFEKQVNCAGALVALKLIEKGFPLSRIKFLTGNAKDLSRYDLSYGVFGGNLEENVVNKDPQEIGMLRRRIIQDEYYNSRNLILKIADLVLNLKEQKSDKIELTRQRHPYSRIAHLTDLQEKLRLTKDIFKPVFPEEVIIKESKAANLSYNSQKYSAFLRVILLDFSNNNFEYKEENRIPDPRIAYIERKYDLLRIIRNLSYHTDLLSTLDAKGFAVIYALYISLVEELYNIRSSELTEMFFEHFSVLFGKEFTKENIRLSEDDFLVLEYKLSAIKEKYANQFGSLYQGFYNLSNLRLDCLKFDSAIDCLCVIFWSRIIGNFETLDRGYLNKISSSPISKLLTYIIVMETLKFN